MDNAQLWKEVRRLKRRLRRKRSSSSRSNSPSPRPETVTPSSLDQDIHPRKRRRIISSESSCSSMGPPIDQANPAAEENQDDIFAILGEDPTQAKQFGDEIHTHVAIRWNNILQKGIKNENRSDLTKRYLIPENCTYLKAPTLNDEIKAAVQESSVKRDSKLEQKQNQLGAGITCIARAFDAAIKVPDKQLRESITRHLGDGGQILSDLHYLESLTRRSLLAQGLNKNTRDAIKDVPRDHLLFGESLGEKLKAIKACSKSAAEIKQKPPRTSSNVTRPETRGNPNTAASLNWRGSSRRAVANTSYNNMRTGAYRERRQAPAPAPQRRAQTSRRSARHHRY